MKDICSKCGVSISTFSDLDGHCPDCRHKIWKEDFDRLHPLPKRLRPRDYDDLYDIEDRYIGTVYYDDGGDVQ